jgi:hypothetical protein
MRPRGRRATLPPSAKEEAVHHDITGMGWLWTGVSGIFWILFLGAVVYLAVRFAAQHARRS